ncbi:uncharacterized protein METZ01_LOCUS361307, partial [marine metagenome]
MPGRQDHARSTESKLKSVAFTESLLDRVQFPIGRQALNRCNFLSFALHRQKGLV